MANHPNVTIKWVDMPQDAINEKLIPLKDYKPVTNVTAEEQLRKLKLGI